MRNTLGMRRYGHVLCIILFAATAFAEWKRYMPGNTGESIDSPPAYTLRYFRGQPCRETDPNDRPFECGSPASRAAQPGMRTTLQMVGRIDGFTIYDLKYFSPGKTEPDQRSVLVSIGPDEVHEIHVQGNAIGGTFFPIKIIAAGQQSLIEVKWDDGGNAHSVHEDYFLLTKEGAILLDFAAVITAAKQAIPPGMIMYQPTSRFDFNAFLFSIGTFSTDSRTSSKLACCTGRVDVQYRLIDGRIVPGRATYVPDSPWR
jgi:hypothetical protein